MIVKEYRLPDGVLIRIADDAYAGKTEEELERVRNNARRIAWDIMVNAMRREQKQAEQGV